MPNSSVSKVPDREQIMDWDEQKPRPAKAITLGEDLRTLSVSELEERLVELGRESDRVRGEIQAAAAAVFKT